MNPYWCDEKRNLIIYNADSLEVMRELEERGEHFRLSVTDPPYNRDVAYAAQHDDSLPPERYELWSKVWFAKARSLSDTVVFTCGMQNLGMWERIEQPTWWLAWDTVNRLMKRTPLGYNRWEPVAVYGTAPNLIPDIFHAPIISEDNPVDHPCPKPLSWAMWLVDRFSEVGWKVFDPFLGTGPIMRACARLGRSCVGVDMGEAYCEDTVRRLEKDFEQPPLITAIDISSVKQEALALDDSSD